MLRSSFAAALALAIMSSAQPAMAERLALTAALDGCILLAEVKEFKLDDGSPTASLNCDKFAPDILSHVKSLETATVLDKKSHVIHKFGAPNVELARCIDFLDGTASCTFYVIGKTGAGLTALREQHTDEEIDLVAMFGLNEAVRNRLKSEDVRADDEDPPKKRGKSLAEMLDHCVTESLATEVIAVLGANGALVQPSFPVLACATENAELLDQLKELAVGEVQSLAGANGAAQEFYLFGSPEKHLAQCTKASGQVTCSFLFPDAKQDDVDAKRMNVLLVNANMQDFLPLNDKTLRAVGPGQDLTDDDIE